MTRGKSSEMETDVAEQGTVGTLITAIATASL